jgi:hypothetical protein
MTRRPLKNVGTSVHARLLRLARERGEDFQLVLTRYANERLLFRLTSSKHAERFVLKGAALFTVWTGQPHRTTRDLDLLAFGDPGQAGIRAAFADLLSLDLPDDGVTFDVDSLTVGPIQEEQEYGGVRVELVARGAKVQLPLQVDVGFGDAITPAASLHHGHVLKCGPRSWRTKIRSRSLGPAGLSDGGPGDDIPARAAKPTRPSRSARPFSGLDRTRTDSGGWRRPLTGPPRGRAPGHRRRRWKWDPLRPVATGRAERPMRRPQRVAVAPWTERRTTLRPVMALCQTPRMLQPPDESMIDEHLDCTGRMRRFRIETYAAGNFLHAVELRPDGAPGLRFVLPVPADGTPPYGDIRDRIRERLSRRDLVQDADGNLRILHKRIRGQLTEGSGEQQENGLPAMVVDDLVVSWEDIGRLLAPYIGWGIRIAITDCGEE